jgi:hypothetical protein
MDATMKRNRSTGLPEVDVTEYCPSCGARGQWQKCKLICTNPKCSIRIILACVD